MGSYKRVLLKISGETVMGKEPFGISQEACVEVAAALKTLHDSGVEIGLVVGGGNIFRGIHLQKKGLARTPADQMGMLGTLINGLALQEATVQIGCEAVLMSALECPKVARPYNWKEALHTLENGKIVFFVGGTGNPYFTTDTAAALRAGEIHANIFLKATKVDGVYNKDPLKYPDAIKYDTLSYSQALAEKLEIMDATALALCRNEAIPIFVFNMQHLKSGKITQVLAKPALGTLIQGE